MLGHRAHLKSACTAVKPKSDPENIEPKRMPSGPMLLIHAVQALRAHVGRKLKICSAILSMTGFSASLGTTSVSSGLSASVSNAANAPTRSNCDGICGREGKEKSSRELTDAGP